MVDKRAAKFALLAAGSVLLVLLAGQLFRWVTRMLAWAILAGIVVLLAYVAYELYSGWTAAAAEGEEAGTAVGERTADDGQTAAVDGEESVDALRGEYVSGSLSDEEFEAELEELLDDGESEPEYEYR